MLRVRIGGVRLRSGGTLRLQRDTLAAKGAPLAQLTEVKRAID